MKRNNFYYSTTVVVSHIACFECSQRSPVFGGGSLPHVFQWVETFAIDPSASCMEKNIPKAHHNIPFVTWVFLKIGVPQNGWFIMENPIKLDDLGVQHPHKDMFHEDPSGMCTSKLSSKTSALTVVDAWFNMPITSTVWSKGQASKVSR